jgi:hypothetical protein
MDLYEDSDVYDSSYYIYAKMDNHGFCLRSNPQEAERKICLCKKTCLPGKYLDGNSCEPCSGVIEAAYTDDKLDRYDVPTYVPEKCVTKDELKTRYNYTTQAELAVVQAELDACESTLGDHNKLKTTYNELVCRL